MPVKKHNSKPFPKRPRRPIPNPKHVTFTVYQDGHSLPVSDLPENRPQMGEDFEYGHLSGKVVKIQRTYTIHGQQVSVYLKPTDPCQNCEHREHRG